MPSRLEFIPPLLAVVVDYPATIYNLRRIKVGGFDIEMADLIDNLY